MGTQVGNATPAEFNIAEDDDTVKESVQRETSSYADVSWSEESCAEF